MININKKESERERDRLREKGRYEDRDRQIKMVHRERESLKRLVVQQALKIDNLY